MLIIAAAGCGPKNIEGPLYLVPSKNDAKGFSVENNAHVFEHDLVKISVKPLAKGESAGHELLDGLLKRDYFLIRMSIENRSDEKLTYNPSQTALTDFGFSYNRPLDFTDLYDVFSSGDGTDEDGALVSDDLLNELKGSYYDNTITIQPGESVSRFLIFSPFKEKAKAAELRINDIYIGPRSKRLIFPFLVKSGT